MAKKGNLLIVTVVLVVQSLLLLAACGGDSGNAGLSNAELVKQGITNNKSMKSYHIDMSATQGDQTVQMSGDVDVANSKYKLTGSVRGTDVGIITIGNDVWVSADGGKTYTKSDPSQASGMETLYNIFKNAKPENADQIKDKLKDGNPPTEKVDNVDTKHITANVQDLGALGSGNGIVGNGTGTTDLWISTDAKPLVRRLKIDGGADGQPVKADITWTKIDQPVDIQAPATQ